MRYILLYCFVINTGFVGCQQKKLFIRMQQIEEKELKIYFGKKDFPKLNKDSNGNYNVNFDTSNIINTSTDIEEIKNLRDIFCIGGINKCLSEDAEIESLGFKINGYSHFTTEGAGKITLSNSFHFWLIERVKRQSN